MNTEELNTKIELCEAAIELHLKDQFSIPNLTDKTGKTASEIYALFPSKKSILQFYYPALVIRYRAMVAEIKDFDSYSISEKLSNFIFTLFDMMEERDEFVEDTFEKFEWASCKNTEFQKEVKKIFRDFFTTDANIATSAAFFMGDFFYGSLRTQYLFLIKFWLEDDSEGRERTFALADKITSFIEELVYSKIVDKGFDLFKYALSTSGIGDKADDFSNWVSHWFDEDIDENKNERAENE